MIRLFRQPRSGIADWISLGLFAAAYICALALGLVPGLDVGNP